MNPKVIFSVCLALTTLTACSGRAATTEKTIGKYQVSKTSTDDGKYKSVRRVEGRYVHMVQPYIHMVDPYLHIHDNRELGTYTHIHVPYDGGYGPYAGILNPYEHDESGKYDKYTVSNAEFKIPVLKLDYGFPDPPVEVKKCNVDNQNVYDSSFDETTTTTTRRPPPTTTTTTAKPRIHNYHDEGGWRILRQEEEKAKHKYDFLYLTENGIYGEEKAHLRKDSGTSASGYYEYTGDDGEVYRVNYKSDERGFIPEADHIPTPPPIPDAIKRALEYVAKKKETHGLHTGQYAHKAGPSTPYVRPSAPRAPVVLQNMPTVDRPLPTLPQIGAKPALTVPPLPTFATQPRFTQYNPDNKYEPLPSGVGSINSQKDYESTTVASYIQSQQDEPQQEEPLKDEPVKVEEPQKEQPLQEDQPQQVEPAKVEELQKEEPLQEDQPKQIEPAKIEEPLQEDQPQQEEPAKVEEPLQQDQPQLDEPAKAEELPQSDQPQHDEPAKAEELPQSDQPQQDEPAKDEELPQSDQPQLDEPAKDEELPQSDQPQQDEPAKDDELPQSDQPQQDEPAKDEELPQSDQPQQDEPAKDEELPQSDQPQQNEPAKDDELPQSDQPQPQASEQNDEFKPPYQVPENLRNEDNYEYTTA